MTHPNYLVLAGSRLQLDHLHAVADGVGGRLLHLLCTGGSIVNGSANTVCLWMPLRGRMRVTGNDCNVVLERGSVYISEGDRSIEAAGMPGAIWACFAGPQSTWSHARLVGNGQIVPSPGVFPGLHRLPRGVLRAFVRAMREALVHDPQSQMRSPDAYLGALAADLQTGFDALVAKCPGRTLARRRQAFLRLQRVHNQIALSRGSRLDVGGLARLANYSPSHFIRAFRLVFGDTPYAFALRHRVEQARRLIGSSALAISDVARAAGFDNRASFARAFRMQFGRTAAQVRRDPTIPLQRTA